MNAGQFTLFTYKNYFKSFAYKNHEMLTNTLFHFEIGNYILSEGSTSA